MNAFSFLIPKLDDTAGRMWWKVASFLGVGLGLYGVDHIHDTGAHDGAFWCVHALGGDAVIERIKYSSGTSNEDLTAVTLANGDRIYGQIIYIKLTSGRVEAYRAGNKA